MAKLNWAYGLAQGGAAAAKSATESLDRQIKEDADARAENRRLSAQERLMAIQEAMSQRAQERGFKHSKEMQGAQFEHSDASQQRGFEQADRTQERGLIHSAEQGEANRTLTREQIAEQARHNKASEANAAKNAETAKAASAKIQSDGEGNLYVIGPDAKAVPVMTAEGQILKGTKDMSQTDQAKVRALQGLIKEDTEALAKVSLVNTAQMPQIQARIDRHTRAIGEILKLEPLSTTAPTPRPAGDRKPLSSFIKAE